MHHLTSCGLQCVSKQVHHLFGQRVLAKIRSGFADEIGEPKVTMAQRGCMSASWSKHTKYSMVDLSFYRLFHWGKI